MSGLEVVGSIASVAQLAGTVYSISKTLYEVSNALSNAPSDIKDLAGDLERFSEELHLYARLLDKKHYDDHFHRLTANIIGECATICTKIDRVLRKLRTGSVWARVKWLYKEKEIVKLLTRLRDLKFSLLSVLQLMKYLKADHEIDAIKGSNRSLLEGPKNGSLSEETVAQVEATRKKLAGISVINDQDSTSSHSEARPDTLPDQESQVREDEAGHGAPMTSISTSQIGNHATHTEFQSFAVEKSGRSHDTISILPNNTVMQNPNNSVQSFHSAFSYLPQGLEDVSTSPAHRLRSSEIVGDAQIQGGGKADKSNITENMDPHFGLKAEIVAAAMKHYQMNQADAEAWAAASLTQFPSTSTGVQSGTAAPNAKITLPREGNGPSISIGKNKSGGFSSEREERHGREKLEAEVSFPMNVRHPLTANSAASALYDHDKKKVACATCRKRKIKCDGVEPICSTCARLSHDCVYDEVRMKSRPKRNYVDVSGLEERLSQFSPSPNSPKLILQASGLTYYSL